MYKARQARAAKARQATLKQSETLQEEIEKISEKKETSSSSSKGNKTKSKKQQVSFALDEHLTTGIFLFPFCCCSFRKIQFTCSKYDTKFSAINLLQHVEIFHIKLL